MQTGTTTTSMTGPSTALVTNTNTNTFGADFASAYANAIGVNQSADATGSDGKASALFNNAMVSIGTTQVFGSVR